MNRHLIDSTLRTILFPAAFITIGIILSACTENTAYRQKDLSHSAANLDECNKFGGALEHIGEESGDYYLGFVEVDDQGVFFDRDQFRNLTCELTKHAESSGVLISVFVHGWHHNAAPGDMNIEKFKESLATLSQLEHWFANEKGSSPRKTIGIFIGWRGESLHLPPFKYLTFWERKNTAEEISRRSISEALLTIEKIQRLRPKGEQTNRLFIVGHSFGADVVYNALSPILLERLIKYEITACRKEKIRGFGDFVFLINPAFESLQYINFVSLLSERKKYCDNQFPVFAILTSLQDNATKIWFPAGRKLSTLFETYRDIRIVGKNGSDIAIGQRNLDTTAIGHEEILITHELENNKTYNSTAAIDDLIKDECNLVRNLRNGWITKQKQYILNDVVLTNKLKYHPKTPYLIIKVDEEIIPDHNEIYDKQVLNFMRRLVVMSTQEEICAET